MWIAGRPGGSLFLNGRKLYQWGAWELPYSKGEDCLEELNLDTMERTKYMSTLGDELPEAATFGAACAVLNGRAYTFGGLRYDMYDSRTDGDQYYRDVYQLDLTSFTRKWQRLPAVNEQDGPITKYLCGMVSCGLNELFVFGGLGQKADDIPWQKVADYHWSEEFNEMLTNEMHIFNVLERRWTVPRTTGVRPPPCAGFSFTKIDRHRVLLFAGWQLKGQCNDIHILDMSSWHWSGAITQSKVDKPWPSPRSLHTAANLINPDYVCPPNHTSMETHVHFDSTSTTTPIVNEQRVLFVWGQDDDGKQLGETWVLHTVSLTWEKIALPINIKGRKWHSTATYYPTPLEALVLNMGGFEKDAVWSSERQPEDIVLHFGVRSLYKKCLEAVSRLYPHSFLTMYLPKHIVKGMDVWNKTLSRLKESSTYIEM